MLWRSVPFYASEIEDRKAYCFCPVCILSFCPPLWNLNLANNFWTVRARALIFHMNISCDKTFPWGALFFTLWPWPWSLTHFLKPLTLLMTFQQWVLELLFFTWLFPVTKPFHGYRYTNPVSLTSEFGQFFENFNLANKFWTVSADALIFHMNNPCDKTFVESFTLWPWPCSWPIFENYNLAYNFWTVRARALIFHMNIPCDKTIPWVPIFFTMCPWPRSLDHFLKTYLAHNFWAVSARALIFHMNISCDKTIPWVTLFLTLCPWPRSLDHFCKL